MESWLLGLPNVGNQPGDKAVVRQGNGSVGGMGIAEAKGCVYFVATNHNVPTGGDVVGWRNLTAAVEDVSPLNLHYVVGQSDDPLDNQAL